MRQAAPARLPSRLPRRPSAAAAPPSPLRGDSRELGQDLAPVRGERLLLAFCHEVDVELVDADRLELAQLRRRLLGRAEDAEAVADVVRDELAVLRADAGVLVVVVEPP